MTLRTIVTHGPAQTPGGRLLCVDDDSAHNDDLAWRLRAEGYEVVLAADGAECLARLQHETFEVVLLDNAMPGLSGLETLAALREQREQAELPVIMVTADERRELVLRALELGANDFVTKPIDFAVLLARLKTQLAVRRMDGSLRALALHDALTGLANRVLVDDRLAGAVARARRAGSYVGLLLLDLDGLKKINDRLGRAGGDGILVTVARRLRRATRESDTVGRVGGDEFVVIAEINAPAEIDIVARRIAAALAEPFAVDGQTIMVGANIGTTLWHEGQPAELDAMLHRAGEAMLRARSLRAAQA